MRRIFEFLRKKVSNSSKLWIFAPKHSKNVCKKLSKKHRKFEFSRKICQENLDSRFLLLAKVKECPWFVGLNSLPAHWQELSHNNCASPQSSLVSPSLRTDFIWTSAWARTLMKGMQPLSRQVYLTHNVANDQMKFIVNFRQLFLVWKSSFLLKEVLNKPKMIQN